MQTKPPKAAEPPQLSGSKPSTGGAPRRAQKASPFAAKAPAGLGARGLMAWGWRRRPHTAHSGVLPRQTRPGRAVAPLPYSLRKRSGERHSPSTQPPTAPDLPPRPPASKKERAPPMQAMPFPGAESSTYHVGGLHRKERRGAAGRSRKQRSAGPRYSCPTAARCQPRSQFGQPSAALGTSPYYT